MEFNRSRSLNILSSFFDLNYIVLLLSIILIVALVPKPNFASEKFLPDKTLIPPPVSAPRQPYNSVEAFILDADNSNNSPQSGSAVSLGHQSGLYRFDNFMQLNLEGGLISHFREMNSDINLISSDFYFGFPVSIKDDEGGWRINLFHLSSHLGDEFQEQENAERISFSHESIRVLRFYNTDWGELHFGGEWAINPTPSFDEGTIHLGGAYWTNDYLAALHASSRNRHDWDPLVTARWEYLFGENQLGLGLKAFDGPLPIGQFFRQERSYLGIYVRFYPEFMRNYLNQNMN